MRALNRKEALTLEHLVERRGRYIDRAGDALASGENSAAKMHADEATKVQAQIHQLLGPARKERSL